MVLNTLKLLIYVIIDINIICRSDLKMELVDLFNARKELTGDTCERDDVPSGKYRLSIHIWIINDNGEILIQQRSSNRKMFPNMWANTGGAALAGEQSLETVLRELKEELNIEPNIVNLELIASYKRKKDYVDVWALRENFDLSNLKLKSWSSVLGPKRISLIVTFVCLALISFCFFF